ncbi:spermatogenesis-associated protein 17 isoform X2 [Cephus cinctus]|uniref:Spermatogenesis-associated protein 17 isoform X2 n=1 Tax=Cephus cinctus TaxID=211228 RepID=A0AAJ7W682_CEPCN|nr:spermatogenesis-associated protein 17 isoform X2 [Cephus cinctus]
MASVIALKNDKCKFENEVRNREQEAEFMRRILFMAARKIQAWFRGILTRNHIRSLHERVTTIQRHWRGYRGRVYAEFYLVESVVTSWKQYYDTMAGKIQAVWRGYWVRKNAMDIGKFRQWLDYVYKKNNETVEQMRKFRESELENARKVTEYESMLWILYILFKLHHLLGTKQRPGVMSRIEKNKFISVEKMMQCLEYSLYNKKKREDNCCCEESIDPPLMLKGTRLERCEKEIREFEKKLRAGKIPIYRSQSYEEDEKILQNIRRPNDKMPKGKNQKKPAKKIGCSKDDKLRLPVEKYKPIKEQFPRIRPPRDKNKELSGDFKLIIKPNEVYETICKMECGFNRLHITCPIHQEEMSILNMYQ